MADDTNRPDLEEAYMQDAIATAKQMGAVVKDHSPQQPSHMVQGDDVAIEEHIAGGIARGTIKDATPETGNAAMARLARAQGSKTAGDIAGEQPSSGSFADRVAASKGADKGQGRG